MSRATELATAKEELATALRAGKDTGQARAKIKQLEAGLKAEQQKTAEAEQQKQAAEAEKVAKTSEAALLNEKAAMEAAATVEGLAELLSDDERLAEAPDDPDLANAVQSITRARMALEAANERHESAMQAVTDLNARINEKRTREAVLRDERLSGSDEGAAELHAIALDIEGLEGLLSDAKANAAQMVPDVEKSRLAEAQGHLTRVKARQVAATLRQRTFQAEAVFIAAHEALVEASMAAGETNRFTVFKPSSDLKFITYGVTR